MKTKKLEITYYSTRAWKSITKTVTVDQTMLGTEIYVVDDNTRLILPKTGMGELIFGYNVKQSKADSYSRFPAVLGPLESVVEV